ncbi:hypothetical protein SEMRO_2045_G312420.1 [Seminavis robusta]|uniref:Uncharacterized protein n=1 Tax=Seminavis robusta TaxID=568900 RepID=A0A9N8HYP9_9STRA|nr:hypothetical protein SEMRO_2045_G312420.1 [Seminavis robusta]|eukprot:Sro2045_g312420.1 n/a (110) ;mRNA; f:2778-3107
MIFNESLSPIDRNNWEEKMYENESDDEHENEEDDLIQKVYEIGYVILRARAQQIQTGTFWQAHLMVLVLGYTSQWKRQRGYNVQLPIPENSLDEDEIVTISADFHTYWH